MRRKRSSRRFRAILCALTVLTFLAAMSSLPPGGHVVSAAPRAQLEEEQAPTTPTTLRDISGADPDNAYAVGARGTILHFRSSPRLDALSPATARSASP